MTRAPRTPAGAAKTRTLADRIGEVMSPDKPQCQYVTRSGVEGFLCCGRDEDHEGPHVGVHVLTWQWMTRDEWQQRHGAAARACYGQPPAVAAHRAHGVESPDEYPNATHCPCVGVAPRSVRQACAKAGCRYCTASLRARAARTSSKGATKL